MYVVAAIGNDYLAQMKPKDSAAVKAGFYAKIRVDWDTRKWYPNEDTFTTSAGTQRPKFTFTRETFDAAVTHYITFFNICPVYRQFWIPGFLRYHPKWKKVSYVPWCYAIIKWIKQLSVRRHLGWFPI